MQSEQTIEYVLPAGTELRVADARWEPEDREPAPANCHVAATQPSTIAIVNRPVPVRVIAKDRTDTRIGGAQKDTVREWASKAANMQPVMWAGIAMMTLVAGVLVYFGWWTKAAVAMAVGLAMVVLAQTLPDHGTMILFGGLAVFAVAALLVLYAYHKGQLDKNNNGIPDVLERQPASSTHNT